MLRGTGLPLDAKNSGKTSGMTDNFDSTPKSVFIDTTWAKMLRIKEKELMQKTHALTRRIPQVGTQSRSR